MNDYELTLFDTPRYNEFENIILGCLLQEPKLLNDISCYLAEGKVFRNNTNRIIYRGIVKSSHIKNVDWNIIFEHTEEFPDKELFFTKLIDCAPTTANILNIATSALKTHQKRALQELCLNIFHKVMKDEFAECSGEMKFGLEELSALGGVNAKSFQAIADIAKPEIIDDINGDTKGIHGISTGVSSLDYNFKLDKTNLYIIAARPSWGKTSLAVHVAVSAAKEKYRVLIFSCESSSNSIFKRMEKNFNRIIPSKGNLAAITLGIEKMRNLGIDIIDDNRQTIDFIEATSRAMFKKNDGYDLVIIDYLQKVKGRKGVKYFSDKDRVADTSGSCKELAKELNVPFLVLAQLNRSADLKSPSIASIKDCGDIEQDADVILLIGSDDPDMILSDEKFLDVKFFIGKNRDGMVGVKNVTWHRPTFSYDSGHILPDKRARADWESESKF